MEFENERNFCNKKISKIRRIKNIDNLVWEIDTFERNVIIAEVELLSIEDLDKVILPNKIKDVLIGDITGVKEYSNFFMAK
jgi:CYTH domain-containing protein